ncbi:MAG: proton-conducting transporter membrane subunit, partial [Planctomycetota bacterium]
MLNHFAHWLEPGYQWVLWNRPLFERTLFLIPLLPFAGFLINGFFGRRLSRRAAGDVAIGAALGAFAWACLCCLCLKLPAAGAETRNALHATYGRWLSSGDFSVSFGLFLDRLSAVMILVVTGVGAVIHIYSAGYMARDSGLARYFAYLNLFVAAMCVLVLGDNLLVLFVGWEGVGLCSYLLIGFWYEDAANAAAGMKAFVVNRIGDLGFTLGILALIAIFGTSDLVAQPVHAGGRRVRATPQVYLKPAPNDKSGGVVTLPKAPGLLDYGEALRLLSNDKPAECLVMAGQKLPPQLSNLDLSRTVAARRWPGMPLRVLLTFACVLLFIGAIGKSAQIPLYVWLPDAMAGPTPVSALIHAATMVTAGVYMVCRLHGLYAVSPEALHMVAVIGGATALFSALMALTQL